MTEEQYTDFTNYKECATKDCDICKYNKFCQYLHDNKVKYIDSSFKRGLNFIPYKFLSLKNKIIIDNF